MSETEAKPGETNEDTQPLQGDDLLEQIAQRRFESSEADTTPADANAPARREEQAATGADERHLVDDLANTFVKAKVYGEEREVPVADLLKNYQIDQAAETKLQQAKVLEHLYQQRLAELDNPPANRQPTVNAPEATDKKAALTQLFDAWSNGDDLADEDIAKLFGNTSQAQQPAIDPVALTQQVRQQMAIDDTLARYQTDYADIAQDPFLDNMAASYLEHGLQQGKPFDAALLEAAEQTRDWLRQKTGQTGPANGQKPSQTSDAAQRRANAQANLKNTPTTTASARQPLGAPKPPSIEEIRRQAINEMMAGN